jgi:hypothetical protein
MAQQEKLTMRQVCGMSVLVGVVLFVSAGMWIAGAALIKESKKIGNSHDKASPSTDFTSMGKVCKVEKIDWYERNKKENKQTPCSDEYV